MKEIDSKTLKECRKLRDKFIYSDENVIKVNEDKRNLKMLPFILVKHLLSLVIVALTIYLVYEITADRLVIGYSDYNEKDSLVVAIIDTVLIFIGLSGAYLFNALCPFKFANENTERLWIMPIVGMNDFVTDLKVYEFTGKVDGKSISDMALNISISEFKNTVITDAKIQFISKDGEVKEFQNNFSEDSIKLLNKIIKEELFITEE